MTMVPPRPVGAAGKSRPQPVQSACWSRFCVPQRPHCFIERGTIAFLARGVGAAGPSGRAGGPGEVAGGGAAVAAAASGGGVKAGGAMPIIVPRRLAGALAGSGLGASGLAAAGGGGSGAMIIVPPKPCAWAGKSSPQVVQVACSSRFCAPQRPHCFISRRTIAFSGCCRGARDVLLRASRPAQIGRGFVRIRCFDLWG